MRTRPDRARRALLHLLLALSALARPAAATETVTRETVQMGTYARYAVVAPDRARGLALAGAAIDAVAAAEDVLSTFRPASEVSAINRAPVGEPAAVSALFLDLVAPAFAIAESHCATVFGEVRRSLGEGGSV